jgi:hypothetical protein
MVLMPESVDESHSKSPIRVEFVICGVSELINVVQAVVLHELGDQSPWGPSVRGHVFPVLAVTHVGLLPGRISNNNPYALAQAAGAVAPVELVFSLAPVELVFAFAPVELVFAVATHVEERLFPTGALA